jgi:hypothetical protein
MIAGEGKVGVDAELLAVAAEAGAGAVPAGRSLIEVDE